LRLGLARDRRRPRDARQPLLLPRDRARDVHAGPRGTAAATRQRRGERRRTCQGNPSPPRRRRRVRRLRRFALRRPAADRPRAARGKRASCLGEAAESEILQSLCKATEKKQQGLPPQRWPRGIARYDSQQSTNLKEPAMLRRQLTRTRLGLGLAVAAGLLLGAVLGQPGNGRAAAGNAKPVPERPATHSAAGA